MTHYDKLENIFVRCAADFITRRHNLHYKISSQHKLKSEDKYAPESAHIKLELYLEKITNEGESFQALSNKHSQVLADFQLKLKSLTIGA